MNLTTGKRQVIRWAVGAGALAGWVLSATPVTRAADEPPIWTGVFTAEQVARGKENFEANCARCHQHNLEGSDRGPALSGDNFWNHWENETLNTLFTKVRDQMPPNLTGNQLEPQAKLEIVAYVLSRNDFPTGKAELKQDRDALDDVQILKKGALASLPNFTVVQVVGCLAKASGDSWELTRGSKPSRAPQTAMTKADKPLGDEKFVLSSVKGFNPDANTGRKVEARGLLYAGNGGSRLDLTAMQTLSESCGS
jgi:mono/diheme cytochrome c family protein